MLRSAAVNSSPQTHLVTLAEYAGLIGRAKRSIRHRQQRDRSFPRRAGSRPPSGPSGRGRGQDLYDKTQLDRYFAAHRLLPSLPLPLPAGTLTLQTYAAQLGCRLHTVLVWSRKPEFPAAIGRVYCPPGGGLGPRVYQKAQIDVYVARHCARRPRLKVPASARARKISVTVFNAEFAHVSDRLLADLRRSDRFPPALPDGRYRLGDLADWWNAHVAGSLPGTLTAHRVQALIDLGRKVATARTDAGFASQRELAQRAGCCRSAVSDIERGHQHVGRGVWAAIDQALGADGAIAGQYARIMLTMSHGQPTCGARLGSVSCRQPAGWVLTIPAPEPARRSGLFVCATCGPLAWQLTVRQHGTRIGLMPAYAAGYQWRPGRCSCCGETATTAAAPSCARCRAAGCDIEIGIRACGVTGPPPFHACRSADRPVTGTQAA